MTHPAPATPLTTPDVVPVRRALVSVYDKTGLVELATALAAAGVEIVSTGSTASTIAAAGVAVTGVEDVTGFPEMLDGRVKTLHPRVHAGILADRRIPEHVATLTEHGIDAFDLVVVNLYPFAATVASGAGQDECVELIDIGGPSMVRAAAKNHASVAVVVDPASYAEVVTAVTDGGFTLTQRRSLAAGAFRHTASYDVDVASWMGSVVAPDDVVAREGGDVATGFPGWVGATWERAAVLRYGENPHQRAALYVGGSSHPGLAQAEQLHGKEMSFNNYVDADAAWRAAWDHPAPAVAIIKHANPCGIAVGDDIATAHAAAHACDPVSAFGGVIAANREVTAAMAAQVAEVFTEVVLAPSYESEALEILQRKKNVRLLVVEPPVRDGVELRPISGGVLLQARDAIDAVVDGGGDDPTSWTLAAGEPADEATLRDLAFAWRAVRAVKSNAILLADTGASVGVGMGQVNRVDSCRLAVERANAGETGERARGAVAASDAFFPFADGAQVLIDAGVRAIVQPGGSVRDAEVVEAAAAAGVTMYLTGTRHFAH
ncbi:bifunctional phosphoribosylaminoimidazolecarboxamide formyltransferase/inosine monophosphate cyclohydrolase [Serinibacter arcticus]|uniref:Bifunctional purine biosynthesis protein PurH n=1 Tax=Serinibacter arcticus TaxID=1655435 RepID=A0A2U1ZTR7_9MICO|nr:bifunctional phosphoribosylaminoimidazolecarboxamide formyltransferase/IMP cyclohydrolase [Serinibacter arcticus]PWD50378.1 bifunctional phosphoribosylaminoimidazolecarboxamide formyltransferase/inosine monophosphate cyclohydrolase [Serinibacter arcticus]